VFVREGDNAEYLSQETIYGESKIDADFGNHRGKVYQLKDQAGQITNMSYDYEGNLSQSSRAFAKEYETAIDWNALVKMEDSNFETSWTYDALQRVVSEIRPDGSQIETTFNRQNLPKLVSNTVNSTPKPCVVDTGYNANRQQVKITYANGTQSEMTYDPQTFNLIRKIAVRAKTTYRIFD
jgi:YD repeat-containing protein